MAVLEGAVGAAAGGGGRGALLWGAEGAAGAAPGMGGGSRLLRFSLIDVGEAGLDMPRPSAPDSDGRDRGARGRLGIAGGGPPTGSGGGGPLVFGLESSPATVSSKPVSLV